MDITIKKSILRALANFVATDDLRPAMECIALEPAEGGIWAVATDAFVLGAHWIEGETLEKTVLIPARQIKGIIKKDRNADEVRITDDGEMVRIADGQSTISVVPTDARYPEWQAVIPNEVSSEGLPFIQLQPCLMERAYKAAHELGLTPAVKMGKFKPIPPVIYGTTPNRGVLLNWAEGDNFVVLVMPVMRPDHTPENWVFRTKLNGKTN